MISCFWTGEALYLIRGSFKVSKLIFTLQSFEKKNNFGVISSVLSFLSVWFRENDGLPFYLFPAPGLILICQGCNSLTTHLHTHTHTHTHIHTHILVIQTSPAPGIDQSAPWPGVFHSHQNCRHTDPDPNEGKCYAWHYNVIYGI